MAGDDDATKYHLQNVRWYVGESPNYWENDQCPDGPYMNRDDADTYYYDELIVYRGNSNIFSKGIGYMHRGGLDVECNLYGRFVTMTADMSEEIGNGYSFDICSLGIFGISYAQDETLISYARDETLPEAIEIFYGDFPSTFAVQNLYPIPSTHNAVDISLRQAGADQLSFVKIEELDG